MRFRRSVYGFLMLISLFLIVFSYQMLWQDLPVFLSGNETIEAKVTHVISESDEKCLFEAEIVSHDKKGEKIEATQDKGSAFLLARMQDTVKAGDRVVLEHVGNLSYHQFVDDSGNLNEEALDETPIWQFLEFERIHVIYVLLGLFALGLLLLGKKKGLLTLFSLVLTFISVFFFFVPWVLKGYNIYLGLGVTLAYIVSMSILFIAGVNKKAFVTILSTFLGLGVALLISVVSAKFLHLTGYIDENSIYLSKLGDGKALSLMGILFSSILIGATGAVMDMSMDIASALEEVVAQASGATFGSLVKSGIKIGTDVMGTMANTLILAYIGSALTTILLLISYSNSFSHLLSREMISIELLQMLSGAMALTLAVPFTVLIASYSYLKEKKQA